MKTRIATTMIVSFLVSACASTPDATGYAGDYRKGLEHIQVLSGAPDRPFDALGPVSGLMCHRSGLPISQDALLKEAKELRVEANKMGADAVIDTTCQKSGGMSLTANCWASYRCTGQAVQFK